MKKKPVIIILIVAAVAIGGYFGYSAYQKNKTAATSQYQTTPYGRGDLISMVGATGKVAANQTTKVNWQTNGRILSIKVKLGDLVQKDQLLAELDPDSLSQNIISARADLVTAQKNLKDLRESAVAKANAQLKLAQAKIDYDDALDKRTSKDYQRASEATLKQLEANYILAQKAYEKAQDDYSWVEDAPEDNEARAAGLLTLGNAERARDTALANWNYANDLPDANEIGKADASVAVAKAALDDAQREWDRLKNGPDSNDVAAAEARVASAEAAVKMTSLLAPISGTVTESNSMVGDSVTAATNSFRIDDQSSMIVDIQLAEVDISKLMLDQPAEVTYDAISGKKYEGKVIQIGRVGAETTSGVNFPVRVRLTSPDQEVLPGMTAAVNIITDKLTDVLMVPNRALRYKSGQRVVYKLVNNVPTSVNVEIGDTSDLNTQIIKADLKEGDLIVLNPPAENPMQGGPPGAGGGPGGGPKD